MVAGFGYGLEESEPNALIADRGQRRSEVRVLLIGGLGRVVGGRGRLRGEGSRGARVGVGQGAGAAAGSVCRRSAGGIDERVARRRDRRQQSPCSRRRDLTVDLVVSRVARGVPRQGDRSAGGHALHGRRSRRLAAAGRELIGDRIRDRWLCSAERTAGGGARGVCCRGVKRWWIDCPGIAGDQVRQPRMLAGHKHAWVLRTERCGRIARRGQSKPARSRRRAWRGRRPDRVLLDLGLDVVLRRAALVEVRVIPRVVDPAKRRRVRLARRGVRFLELGQQRIAPRSTGVATRGRRGGRAARRPLDAAAAVEQLVDPEVVLRRPARCVANVGGDLSDCVGRAVVGRVRRGVPAVIGEEVIVDVRGQIVALIAEVDAACRPVDRAVAQQLRLQLELVLVERLHHLLDAVGVRVHAHQRRPARSAHERVEVRRAHRRCLVSVGAGVDRHRCRRFQIREQLLPVRRQRALNTVEAARGGGRVQPIRRAGKDVAGDLADVELMLVLLKRRPLRRRQIRNAPRRPRAVRQVAHRHDHRVVLRLQRPVGQRRRQSRTRDRRVARTYDRVKAHPLALPAQPARTGSPVRSWRCRAAAPSDRSAAWPRPTTPAPTRRSQTPQPRTANQAPPGADLRRRIELRLWRGCRGNETKLSLRPP